MNEVKGRQNLYIVQMLPHVMTNVHREILPSQSVSFAFLSKAIKMGDRGRELIVPLQLRVGRFVGVHFASGLRRVPQYDVSKPHYCVLPNWLHKMCLDRAMRRSLGGFHISGYWEPS